MTSRREDIVGGAFGLFVVLPIVCSIIAGAVVLLFDVLAWLGTAVWPVFPLRTFLNHFDIQIAPTGAAGFDLLVSKALAIPVEIYFLLIWPSMWLALGIWLFDLMLRKPKIKKD